MARAFSLLLESKHCHDKGIYFENVVMEQLSQENYKDFGKPLRFKEESAEIKEEYFVDRVSSDTITKVISCYAEYNYKRGDIIQFDNEFYTVDRYTYSVIRKGINRAKRYVLFLK